jgi:hypothetical protein
VAVCAELRATLPTDIAAPDVYGISPRAEVVLAQFSKYRIEVDYFGAVTPN